MFKKYGVVIIRKRKEYEVLLKKQRCTDAFMQFLNVEKCFDVHKLFEKMSHYEKDILASGEFTMIYFHAYGKYYSHIECSDQLRHYKRLENIYRSRNLKKIIENIQNTNSVNSEWEFLMANTDFGNTEREAAQNAFNCIQSKFVVPINSTPFIYKKDNTTWVLFPVFVHDFSCTYKSGRDELQWFTKSELQKIDFNKFILFQKIIKYSKKSNTVLNKNKNVSQGDVEKDNGKIEG